MVQVVYVEAGTATSLLPAEEIYWINSKTVAKYESFPEHVHVHWGPMVEKSWNSPLTRLIATDEQTKKTMTGKFLCVWRS